MIYLVIILFVIVTLNLKMISNKFKIIIISIGIFITFISCNNTPTNILDKPISEKVYNSDEDRFCINHYIDTIHNNIVLTTVVEHKRYADIGVSTLILNNYDE